MSSGKRISRNVLANYLGVFAQIAIAFALTPFLVNTLGDTNYGIWTIVVAVTSFMVLLDLGIGSAINRYVSKYHSVNDISRLNNVVSTAFILFSAIALALILISPAISQLVVNSLNIDRSLRELVFFLIIIMSFDTATFIVTGTARGTFVGLQKYHVINFVGIASNLFKACMFYVFLTHDYGLYAMGFVALCANFLTGFTFFFMLRIQHPEIVIRPGLASKAGMHKILGFSIFTFLGMLSNQIIYYSDTFVIGYFLNAAAVTYYTIPWSLTEYTRRICLAVSRTFVPAFSELEAQSKTEQLYQLYLAGTKVMLVLSNLISVGVLFLGGGLLSIWIGPTYREKCETILMILFVNQLVHGPQMMSYSLLLGLGKHKIYSYVSIGVSMANLVLSIVLVQKYGLIGVAIGAVVPQVLFQGFFVPIYTHRIVDRSILSYLFKTYLPALIPILVLCIALFFFYQYYYPENFLMLIGEAIVSAFVYLFFCYLFMPNSSEREYLSSLVKKRFDAG